MDIQQAEKVATGAESIVSGAGGFLGSLVVKITIGLTAAAILVGLGYWLGSQGTEKKYAKQVAEQAQAILKLEQNISRQQDHIVTQYVDRIRTINKEVPVYVPSDSDCKYLSGNFRVYWDSAAAGVPLPASTGSSDASPVAVSDVADTVAEAARRYNSLAEQLKALQSEREAVSK